MHVYIIDTSSIIALWIISRKYSRKIDDIFNDLTELIENGELIYPPQVIPELTVETYSSYGWVRDNRPRACRLEPNPETLLEIFQDEYTQLVFDPNKETEDADPYILALGWDILNSIKDPDVETDYTEVTVVTNDYVDRLPNKVSLRSCCDKYGIKSMNIETFLLQKNFIQLSNP